ncbi:MAG: hypothetical protein HC767_11600, partial [Akkermansiaceae bacterium]|nr:hypothetical protein [Akkermansiaceae bacterium]
MKDRVDFGFDLEASRPAGLDLRITAEAEARTGSIIVNNESVAIDTVVPDQKGLVNLAIDLKGNDAIALASSRGFEFGNTLFQVGAAAATQIRSFSRCDSRTEQDTGSRD